MSSEIRVPAYSIYLRIPKRIRGLVPHAPIILVMLLLVITGLRGLDFGFHWDEYTNQVQPVRTSIEDRTLLPDFYIYPSVNYWLNLAILAPSVAGALLNDLHVQDHLLTIVDSFDYLLRIRAVHIIVSALAVTWVYLAVWFWRRNVFESLLAGSILGLSWEIAYHSRWAAPDSIMMQFGALTILMMVLLHLNPGDHKWRRFAAAAAALACGTKYPGGLLLIPLLMLVYANSRSDRQPREHVLALLEVAGIFAAIFILATPGVVLQPWLFWSQISKSFNLYGGLGHYGYTIQPGLEHMSKIAAYVSMDLFSPFVGISAIFTAFALIGGVVILSESRIMALIVVFFPVAYSLYFSAQTIMIVRNLLVLAPFLAILSARGIVVVWERLRNPLLKFSLAGGIAAILIVNGAWLVNAGEAIRDRDEGRFVEGFSNYLSKHSSSQFYVSPRLFEDLEMLDAAQRKNVRISDPNAGDFVAIYAFDALPDILDWPANHRMLTIATFGPREVNFNYYPTWEGNDRILIMTVETAKMANVGYGQ